MSTSSITLSREWTLIASDEDELWAIQNISDAYVHVAVSQEIPDSKFVGHILRRGELAHVAILGRGSVWAKAKSLSSPIKGTPSAVDVIVTKSAAG